MNRYVKAWLIPWEPGLIGVGYKTAVGNVETKELRERDPEFPELRALLGPFDAAKLERHLTKVIPFKQSQKTGDKRLRHIAQGVKRENRTVEDVSALRYVCFRGPRKRFSSKGLPLMTRVKPPAT